MRQSRKLDHLHYALRLKDGPAATGFDDVTLIHNCLPELDWEALRLETRLAGIRLAHPVVVNAITGGADDVTKVNALLAEFAAATRAAMAVGSQYAAIEDPAVRPSYEIVRRLNPDGVVFANLGAHAGPDEARAAVEMVRADALQVHLNVAQELVMPEGDRAFSGYLRNIEKMAAAVPAPLIVKEIGCGMAREQAERLAACGVRALDTGGAGGTNFIAIENARAALTADPSLAGWGIPTVISALEVGAVKGVDLMVSGGVRTPLEVVKALAIGARAVGIAGPILRAVLEDGPQRAAADFTSFLHAVKRYMMLTGAATVSKLARVPFIVSGYSRQWLECRGLDPRRFALRRETGDETPGRA